MKKTILVLLAILLAVTVATALVACNQDPCQSGHTWDDGEVIIQPTCTAEGTRLLRCKVCGATQETPEPKTEHEWGEVITTQLPTCGKDGVGSATCKNCSTTKDDFVIPATGEHVVDFDKRHAAEPATCFATGTVEYYECKYCDTKLTANGDVLEDVSTPTIPHNYDSGVVTEEPTCTTPGTKTFTCQNEGCTGEGHTYTQEVPAIDHVYGVLVSAKDATCLAAGNIAYYQCSECHLYFNEAKEQIDESEIELEIKDHEWVIQDPVAATCTSTGLTDGKYCKNCGTVEKKQETTDKIPHTPVPFGEKAATCTERGYTAGSQCSVCGTTIVEPKVVDPLGHAYTLTEWKWSNGNNTCTAEFDCGNKNCPESHVSVQAEVTSEDVLDYKVFTARAQGPDGKYYTETKQVGEHEHTYELKNWTWADDFSKATAHFNCTLCEDDPQDVEVTPTVTPGKSTCEQAGKDVYTATVHGPDGKDYTDVKEKTLELAEHVLGDKLEYDADHPELGHGNRCENCGKIIDPKSHEFEQKFDATNHWQQCECGYQKDSVGHKFTYNHKGDKSSKQHTVGCEDCKYNADEACEFDDGSDVCTKCGTKFDDGKEELIVHFHVPTNWTISKLKLYVYIEGGDTTINGDFPGKEGWVKDTENDGWYTYTIRVPRDHIGKDLYVIPTDKVLKAGTTNEYDGNQTGNVLVVANEVWVPANAGEKSYRTKEEALDAEVNAPKKSDYFITGCFQGAGKDEGFTPNTSDWNRVFTEDNEWTLKSEFAAGDTFRVRQNVEDWNAINSNFNFGDMTIIGATEGVDYSGLLTDEGGTDRNIKVNRTCTLKITFNPSDKQIKIFVVSADKPSENTPKYVVVGTIGGVDDWNTDSTKHPLQENADGSYTITLSVKKNDKFQIVEYGTWNAIWGSSTKPTITYDGVSSVANLFGASGNDVVANYDITFTVTYRSNKIYVNVTAISEGAEITDWYISGDMNNWTEPAAWKFTDNKDGTFTLANKTIKANQNFKVRSGALYYNYKEVTQKGTAFTSTYFVDNTSDFDNIKCVKDVTVDIIWQPSTKTLTINFHVEAHTHAYELDKTQGTNGWVWSDDYKTATAHFICNGAGTCDAQTKQVTATEITEKVVDGKLQLSATVKVPETDTDITGTIIYTPQNYHFTGIFDGVGHWADSQSEKFTWDVDTQKYTFTVSLKAGDVFLIKLEGTENKLGFAQMNVTWAPGLEETYLFKEGEGNNVDVLLDCTLTLSFGIDYKTYDILVTDYTPAFVERKISLVGKINGADPVWGDNSAYPFVWNETDEQYELKDVQFKKGDYFLIKEAGTNDTSLGFMELGKVTYGKQDVKDLLFKQADEPIDNGDYSKLFNIHPLRDCTVTITIDKDYTQITIAVSYYQHTYTVDKSKNKDGVEGLEWNDDNSHNSAMLYLVCECGETLTLEINASESSHGDCTTPSGSTYTVTVTAESATAQAKGEGKLPDGDTIVIDGELKLEYDDNTSETVTGHNWQLNGEITFDNEKHTFTVKLKCSNSIDSGTCNSEVEITLAAEIDVHATTCTQDGYTLYTLDKEASAKVVMALVKDAATEKGIVTSDEDKCQALSKEVKVDGAKATGHDWKITKVELLDDDINVEGMSAQLTITLTCQRDESVCDTEHRTHTVKVSATVVEKTPASCEVNRVLTISKTVTQADVTGLEGDNAGIVQEYSQEFTQDYTVEGSALEHDFDVYDDSVYESRGAEGHVIQCHRCKDAFNDDNIIEHGTLSYETNVAEQTHTGTCTANGCDYKVENESCTIKSSTTSEPCTTCGHDYADKVTVYYHKTTKTGAISSNTNLYLYVYILGSSKVEPYGEWEDMGLKFSNSSISNWVVATFTIARGHVGKDLKVIVNNQESSNSNQTDGILVIQNEIWVPTWVGGSTAYTTQQDAEAAEQVKSPTSSYHFIVGDFNGGEFWKPNIYTWERVFSKDNDYVIVGNFYKGNKFRIITTGTNWSGGIGWSNLYPNSQTALNGVLKEYENDNNIEIVEDCTLKITCSSSTQKIELISRGSFHTHDFTKLVERQAPTCSATGMEAHYKCSCGLYFNESKELTTQSALTIQVDPNAHHWVAQDPHSASCTEDGWETYYKCDWCNKKFATAEAPVEGQIFDSEDSVKQQEGIRVPATGHTYQLDKSGEHGKGYTFSGGNNGTLSVTIYLVCNVDTCAHTTTIETTIESTAHSDADCENDETYTYNKTLTAADLTDKLGGDHFAEEFSVAVDETVTGASATGHSYIIDVTKGSDESVDGQPKNGIQWADDFVTATVYLVCEDCGTDLTVDAQVTTESKAADCVTPGEAVHTATAEQTDIQSKVNSKAASDGKLKGTVTISEEVTRTYQTNDTPSGHEWVIDTSVEGTEKNGIVWGELDGKTHEADVTLYFKCNHANCSETLEITYKIKGDYTAQSCTEDEKTHFEFSKPKDEIQQKIRDDASEKLTDYDGFLLEETISDEHTAETENKAKGHSYTGEYRDDHDGYHSQLCVNGCGTYGEKAPHSNVTYTIDAEQHQHTGNCEKCHELDTEPCTIENGSYACKYCEQDYSKEIVVHYHKESAWISSTVSVTGSFKDYQESDNTHDIVLQAMNVEGTEGWYETTIKAIKDVEVTVNFYNDSNVNTQLKVENVKISEDKTEVWITYDGKVCDSCQDADTDENPNEYVLVGYLNGAVNWDNTITATNRKFTYVSTNVYSRTATFQAGDAFKVKVNKDTTWEWQINATNLGTISKSNSVSSDVTGLFYKFATTNVSDYTNIIVKYNCSATLTINVRTKKIDIQVTTFTKPTGGAYEKGIDEETLIYCGTISGWKTSDVESKYKFYYIGNGTYALTLEITSSEEFKMKQNKSIGKYGWDSQYTFSSANKGEITQSGVDVTYDTNGDNMRLRFSSGYKVVTLTAITVSPWKMNVKVL